MQKLFVELKNITGNTPQVPCSINETLNREETLSVPRTVLANNSSEEDQHSGKSVQVLSVPIINMQKEQIPDSANKSEQIEIPAGLDWIKIIIFKEVKRAILPPIEISGLIACVL